MMPLPHAKICYNSCTSSCFTICIYRIMAIVVVVIPGRFQQKSSFSAAGANKPPCVAKKGAMVEVHDSIRFTQRSKSFKRSIPG